VGHPIPWSDIGNRSLYEVPARASELTKSRTKTGRYYAKKASGRPCAVSREGRFEARIGDKGVLSSGGVTVRSWEKIWITEW
jgi:hypothetical protein